MIYVPFSHVGADPTFEHLVGDRVLVRWTEPGDRPEDAMLCEAVWTVDELAAAQRGEGDLDLDSIREWPLAERIASLRARQDQVSAERDAMVNRFPQLKARRR